MPELHSSTSYPYIQQDKIFFINGQRYQNVSLDHHTTSSVITLTKSQGLFHAIYMSWFNGISFTFSNGFLKRSSNLSLFNYVIFSQIFCQNYSITFFIVQIKIFGKKVQLVRQKKKLKIS